MLCELIDCELELDMLCDESDELDVSDELDPHGPCLIKYSC